MSLFDNVLHRGGRLVTLPAIVNLTQKKQNWRRRNINLVNQTPTEEIVREAYYPWMRRGLVKEILFFGPRSGGISQTKECLFQALLGRSQLIYLDPVSD